MGEEEMTCFRSCLKAAKIQEYSGNSAFADVVVVFVLVVVFVAVVVVFVVVLGVVVFVVLAVAVAVVVDVVADVVFVVVTPVAVCPKLFFCKHLSLVVDK